MKSNQRKAIWASRKGYDLPSKNPLECWGGKPHKQMSGKFGEKFQTCTGCGNYIHKVKSTKKHN